MEPIPSKPTSVDLDRLCSLDDRQALAQLVVQALNPPLDFPRLYDRLRQEEMGKPSGDHFVDALASKGLTGRADERLARDVGQDYLAWTGAGLRHYFLSKAEAMLDWASRLHLKEPSATWSPRQWVETAEALEASPDLLCLVIEKSPTWSWPAWRTAFGLERHWEQTWNTWEACFFRSPALALRWLDDLLAARPSEPVVSQALDGLRARLLVALETGADHPGLLQQLDQRLAVEGALVRLEAVDWSFVLFDGQKPKTPAGVRDAFLAFLRKNEAATRRWLELPVAGATPMGVALNPRSGLRHARVALSVMAHHGQATVEQLRGVLLLVAKSEKSALVKGWVDSVDQVVTGEWGKPLPQAVIKQKPALKKKKAVVKPTPVAAPSPVEVPTVAAKPVTAPASEEIPRFAPR